MSEERRPTGERGLWSSRLQTEVVSRVLREEDLDVLRCELGVTAGTLAQWRQQLRVGGQAAVERQSADDCNDELGGCGRKRAR